jgi:ATP synthase F1 complex assembly factor 1
MTNIEELLKSVQAEPPAPLSDPLKDSLDVDLNESKTQGNNQVQEKNPPRKNLNGLSGVEIKSLNDIMKVELLEPLDAKTIGMLWNQHFSGKPGLSASLTMEFYSQLKSFSKKYPFFILPLPRDSGYEFYFLQFSGDQVYFTSLLEYQTHGSFAKPLLILTHYTELGESKDLVLLRGELGDPSNERLLSPAQAQNLVYQLQLFYATGGPEKQALVEAFHNNPASFDYKSLIDGLEKL